MRLALECPVISKLRLQEDFRALWLGKALTLTRDEQGFVSKIRIEAKVASDDRVRNLVIQEVGKPLHLFGSGGIKIRHELEQDLQAIESALAFYFNVSRIRWEAAVSI